MKILVADDLPVSALDLLHAEGWEIDSRTGRSPEESLRLGWAHGALLTTFPGDVSMATLGEVEALAKGGSARVQR